MGILSHTLKTKNAAHKRKIISRLIVELFPDPDALYLKRVTLDDGRVFFELREYRGDLLRIGGLTQQQAHYILQRIKNPHDTDYITSPGYVAHERVLRERLDICETGARARSVDMSEAAHYVIAPPEDREPRQPTHKTTHKTRRRPTPQQPRQPRQPRQPTHNKSKQPKLTRLERARLKASAIPPWD